MNVPQVVSSAAFYGEYHGHRVEHLQAVHSALRPRPCIFLAGDSSLDCKFYQRHLTPVPALNGYETVLSPPTALPDVAHHLNALLPSHFVLNCAVEESTLSSRTLPPNPALLPQDIFIRDNIAASDTLIISVGGNDIALNPTPRIALSALTSVYLSLAPSHLSALFRTHTASYITSLTARVKPARVVVCMIYFPDIVQTRSWASLALRVLAYDAKPAWLQRVIRGLYADGTCRVAEEVEGLEIVPCPLYEALDGSNSSLYEARVEPSGDGAEAIAKLLRGRILERTNI